MTREIRIYNLYNEDLKLDFIKSNYAESTQKQVLRFLSDAYETEVKLNKDICNFNFEEIEDFLKGLNRKSIQSLYTVVSYLRKYTDYAISKGYSPSRINYLNLIRGTDMMGRYINNLAENIVDVKKTRANQFGLGKYITRRELHNIMAFCENAQDGALFGMLFEGAYGVRLEEIRLLKPKDCNLETGEITLTREDAEKRVIKIVDTSVLAVLEDAIKQMIYEKNNGINENLRTPTFELSDSGYVFRISGRADINPIKTININNRMKKIALLYDNPYLNPVNIWLSGQIDYAKQLKEELGLKELEKEHYEQINERFGYDKTYWFNTKRRIGSFV